MANMPGGFPQISAGLAAPAPNFPKFDFKEMLPVFGIPNAATLAEVFFPSTASSSNPLENGANWLNNKVMRAELFLRDTGTQVFNGFAQMAGVEPIENQAKAALIAYQCIRIFLAFASLSPHLPIRVVGAVVRFTFESALHTVRQKQAGKPLPISVRTYTELGRAVGEALGGGRGFVAIDVLVTAHRLGNSSNI